MSLGFASALTRRQTPLSAALELTFAGATSLDSRITFTRADATSCATYFGSDGLLKTAAANVARFDYDPATPAGVTGGELVTNGDFSQGTTGWTLIGTGVAIAVVNGELEVTATSGSFPGARRLVTTETGKRYLLTATVRRGTTASSVGVTVIGLWPNQTNNTSNTTSTTISVYFTAQSTTSNVDLSITSGTANGTAYFDNISVQEVVFTPRGFLVEESRVNNEQNTLAFSKLTAGDTVTQNAVAPDGTTTAYTVLSDGTTTASHTVYQGAVTPTATNTYTVSVFLKAGTGSLVQIATGTAHSGVTVYCNYNLSTQAMTAGAGIVSGSNFCTSVGGGWYRCGFSYVASATSVAAAVLTNAITSMSDARAPIVAATYSYLRWGGQYESTATMGSAAFATSYIPTTASAVTRAADSASMTLTNFSSWYSQTAGTFVVEYNNQVQGVDRRVYTVDDGTAGNYFGTRLVSANAVHEVFRVGASNYDNTSAVATTLGVSKSAFAYASGDGALSTNGSSVTTSTPTLFTGSRLWLGIGPGGSSGILNGHIRRIQYYPTRLPNATLQALST